jgi:hypothetical protein
LCISFIFSISIKIQFTDPFLCRTSSDAYLNYRRPMLSVVIWETEKTHQSTSSGTFLPTRNNVDMGL